MQHAIPVRYARVTRAKSLMREPVRNKTQNRKVSSYDLLSLSHWPGPGHLRPRASDQLVGKPE
eukprot:2327934-Rhodomonas_salina.1